VVVVSMPERGAPPAPRHYAVLAQFWRPSWWWWCPVCPGDPVVGAARRRGHAVAPATSIHPASPSASLWLPLAPHARPGPERQRRVGAGVLTLPFRTAAGSAVLSARFVTIQVRKQGGTFREARGNVPGSKGERSGERTFAPGTAGASALNATRRSSRQRIALPLGVTRHRRSVGAGSRGRGARQCPCTRDTQTGWSPGDLGRGD